MNLKILTLNCQRGYRPHLFEFLATTFRSGRYDLLLLQEMRQEDVTQIEPLLGEYSLLRSRNEAVGAWSQLTIAYRKEFELEASRFYPFTHIKTYYNIHRPEFGLLMATFGTPEGCFVAGTLHVNAGPQFVTRERELRYMKDCLLTYTTEALPVVFGGDFNSGLPWEAGRNEQIFAPEFSNPTRNSGPTVDSLYIDPIIVFNKIALAMARAGIRFRMKVDHIYTDRSTAETHAFTCRVLPNRVSDHSPLEVSMTPLTKT